MNSERKIRNIIFDLGGVILNIDYKLTESAFKALGVANFEDIYSRQQQSKLFDKFETGEITTTQFRDGVRELAGIDLSDPQIDDAWNKMLISLPEVNLSFLKQLKKQYRLFLLSNTNEIHIEGFTKIITRQYGCMPFDDLFEKIYYSNEIGLRKPHTEIFQKVINENNLKAGETLFIDDTERHLEGAKAAGIHVRHMKTGADLSEFLKDLI